jgi:glucose repression mediator protein
LIGNHDEAINSYEHALRANPQSIPAMVAISGIMRQQEQYHKAVDYLQSILKLDATNGEIWGSLGMPHSFMLLAKT